MPWTAVQLRTPDANDSGSQFSEHDGYVVAPATSNGLVDQVVDDRCHVSASRHGGRDLLAGQLVEETVSTNDESIFFFDSKSSAVDLNIGPDAERSGQDSVMGVLRGFFLTQLSALYEFGRDAVVLGQLGQDTFMP
jgi:hypothetical protein